MDSLCCFVVVVFVGGGGGGVERECGIHLCAYTGIIIAREMKLNTG